MQVTADQLERVWRLLFVGDAPGNRVLQTRADGTCTAVSYVPDGRTRTQTVLVGKQPLTVDVPALEEQVAATASSLAQLADQLEERNQHDHDAARAALSASERAALDDTTAQWDRWTAQQAAIEAATVSTVEQLGRFDVWLRSQPDPDGWLRAVADGCDHLCRRCDGTGHGQLLTCDCVTIDWDAPRPTGPADPHCSQCAGTGAVQEPCLRCAGCGWRRSAAHAQVCDEQGNTATIRIDASRVQIAQQTTRPPADAGRPTWSSYTVSLADEVVTELTAAGITIPDSGVLLLFTDGQTARFDGSKTASAAIGPDGAAAAFLRLVPGGTDPDRSPSWLGQAARRRAALECVFDQLGRAHTRTVRVRAPRPLVAAWQELTRHASDLQAALPASWTAQVWLSTAAIATGEHGPHVQLVAIPPQLDNRPVAVASHLDHLLDRAVETTVDEVRAAGVEQLAAIATRHSAH